MKKLNDWLATWTLSQFLCLCGVVVLFAVVGEYQSRVLRKQAALIESQERQIDRLQNQLNQKMNTKEQDNALLDDALRVLGEHFDAVHIFCNRHESGEAEGTIAVQKGVGNWFARYGQIHDWIVKTDESVRTEAWPS